MPHANSTISPDDEIKVYQDEGEEEQKSSAENLKEVKSSLVTEEEEKANVQNSHASYYSPKNVAPDDERPTDDRSFLLFSGRAPYNYFPRPPFGFVTYAHPTAPLSMVNKVPLVPANHSSVAYFQAPPAHSGIPALDLKNGMKTPFYPSFHPHGQFPPPMFNPDITHRLPWHPSMYALSPGFHSPPFSSSLQPNHFPSKLPSPPTPSHPVLMPGLGYPLSRPKLETTNAQNSRPLTDLNHCHNHNNPASSLPPHHNQNTNSQRSSERCEKKKPHIKKPLNAFMLFMRDQRATVVSECTLKESAAINQLLGKKWHSLSRDEQSKYYDLAKLERQAHMAKYPGWTARDNYAVNMKKKKRKRDKSQEGDANNLKKCRARFGLDQQNKWCKPCRRKKKCIRYLSGSDHTGESEDNIGSVDSLEVPTPDSRFDDDDDRLSESNSCNGDEDEELEVSSEFSLSSPSVPRSMRDNVQSNDPIGSPLQLLNLQHLSRPSNCLTSPDTPPSTDSSTTTAPLS